MNLCTKCKIAPQMKEARYEKAHDSIYMKYAEQQIYKEEH